MTFDFIKYQLLIGKKSIDLFDYYKVDKLHGLNRKDCESYKETKEDAYIAGMANQSPSKGKPFVFINSNRLKGDYRDVTLVMHELMHMSLLVHGWNVYEDEEKIVTWAEEETNWIMKNVINGTGIR